MGIEKYLQSRYNKFYYCRKGVEGVKTDKNSIPFLSHEWKRYFVKYRSLYWLIIPGMITVFIFHYVPIYGVQIAFKDYRASLGIWGSEWVGFKHFIRFFEYRDFWNIIKNTLSISLYSMAVFPVGVIFSLMLNEVRDLKLKKTIQMITYAPHFVSAVVVCSIVIIFLQRGNGVINNMIEALGMERIDFLAQPQLFSSIYVWSGVWSNLGWSTIIYMAALANVSPELIEAAQIDGASRWQIITRINIPCILPTIMIMLILQSGNIMSVGFEKIFLLQNPLNLPAARVISTYVYEIGIEGGQFSYSSAIGFFNNVVEILMLVIVNRISKKLTNTGMW